MADKKHNFTAAELKAGVIVLAAIAVLVLFIAVTQGLRPPVENPEFHTLCKDIGGLNIGADVRFGGLKKGRVVAITPDETDPSLIRVAWEIQKDIPVNEESQASIKQVTLTAQKHLEISTGSGSAERLQSGALVPLASGSGGGMFDAFGDIAKSLDVALQDVRALLGVIDRQNASVEVTTIADLFEDVGAAVNKGTGVVDELGQMLEDSRADVKGVLTKLQDIEDAAKEMADQMNAILAENRADIRGVVDGARNTIETVANLASSLGEEVDKIADGLQATLDNTETLTDDAKLVLRQVAPPIEDMILDLRETVRYIKAFSQTLAEEPQAIIRGKPDSGRR